MAPQALILYGLMAGSALVLQAAFGGALEHLFVFPLPEAPRLEIQVALGVGIGLAAVALSRLISSVSRWARQMDAAFRGALKSVTPGQVPLLACLSATAEELFFRGFLQPRLDSIVWAALFFSLVHVPWDRRLIPWWNLGTFAMGLVFGWSYAVTGSLLAPVLAHFTINYFELHHLLRPRTEPAA